MSDGFTLYRYWLNRDKQYRANRDAQNISEAINESLTESAAYRSDALRNGAQQPIVATREGTNKCKITVMPGDEMYIGDVVSVFGEEWLCKELYTDEYGITYGEIWMCNHRFVYQDFDGTIITKCAIIDDGSYSKGSDKSIPVVDGTYKCYMSLDKESSALFVDKRLAIDTVLGRDGQPILEVGKIKWIDTKSNNYGSGSHLLYFVLAEDVYNGEHDNLELMLCDYTQTGVICSKSRNTCLVINGKDSIRIGTKRTFKARVDGDEYTDDLEGLVWRIDGSDSIVLIPDGASCTVKVPLDDALVGVDFVLSCESTTEAELKANKQVAVIAIG